MMSPATLCRVARGRIRFVVAFILVMTAWGERACQSDDDTVIGGGSDRRGNLAFGVGVEAVGFHPQVREPQYDLGGYFDQHVFGRLGGRNQVFLFNGKEAAPDSSAVDRAIASLRERCERQIETIDAVCALDAAQERRLVLGLESDLKRLASQIEAERERYAGRTMLVAQLNADRALLEEVRGRATKCRGLLDSITGPDSLFASLMHDTLSAKQAVSLDTWMDERRRCRWLAMVKSVLVQLDESGLGLSQAQASALEASLLENPPPLDVLHDQTTGNLEQRAVHFRMMLVASRLGQKRPQWEALLDPRQNASLSVRIDSFGDTTQIEAMLRELGILEQNAVVAK